MNILVPSPGSAVVWLLTVALVGCAVGYLVARHLFDRAMRSAARYREAMLDDWREASDKVARLRTMIRRCRSMAELRVALRRDDEEHSERSTEIRP